MIHHFYLATAFNNLVQKWHVGFGLLGEQGAESIHAKFDALHRTHALIHEKLQHVMKEHLISIAPEMSQQYQ
eukprot:Em1171g1a